MKKLNPEFKPKWLAALRSGEYKQTTGVLKRGAGYADQGTGHCCLGVACVVMGYELKPHHEDAVEYGMPVDNEYGGTTVEVAQPNKVAMEAMGLSQEAVDYLVSLNDDMCMDFDGIADYIEREL